MGTPYPDQQPPRPLERSRSNRVIGGVCGGVADYVNMDPSLVRVLTVIVSLFTGVPVLLYLVALFVMAEEDLGAGPRSYPSVNGGYPYQRGGEPDVCGAEGAPWEQPHPTAPAEPTNGGTSPWRSPSTGPDGSGEQPGEKRPTDA